MNKSTLTIFAALILMHTGPVYAASETTHSGHQGHTMADKQNKEHGAHGSGMKIHTAALDGYTFEYRLIDMKEKMKTMKNMPGMKETHHLMVFVKDSHGKAVTAARVGYFIREKSSGTVQKKMSMAMNNGFGADVTLVPGSHYTIKTKVMAGDKNMIDEFNYMGGDH